MFRQQPLYLGGVRDLGCQAKIGSKLLKKKQKAKCCRLVFMNKKKQKLNGTINDYPLVEVKWLDCISDNSWMSIDKAIATKPAVAISIGYKILQAREKITIFTDYIIDDEDGSLTVGNVTTIPAAWVQEVTEIIFTK